MKLPLRFKVLATSLTVLTVIVLSMEACVQFRMTKSEISHFFSNKKWKGTLHTYSVGDSRMINYLHVGDENLPLVIFVHGSPGSLSAFIHFMDDSVLLKRAQLISVDRAGFGDSNFGRAEKSLKKQAQYLKPILEKYKGKNSIILVGHSLGGPVIARMAIDYQELIDGLVIVAGSIDPDLEPNEGWFRAPLASPLFSWMMPRSFRASNYEIYKLEPELREMLPLWNKITCPTLVIQGTQDKLVSPKNADFAKKMLVNSPTDFVIKENMGHFVPWQHPELIRNGIVGLLDKNKATP